MHTTKLVSSFRRLGEWAAAHEEFIWLWMLFLLFRTMVPFWVRPWVSDFELRYFLESALSDRGFLPFLDYWEEYPPLFPYVALAVYRVTAWIFGPVLNGCDVDAARSFFGALMRVVMGLADAGNLWLIYLLGMRVTDQRGAVRVCWTYALLFTPLQVCLGFFDSLVLFTMLFGVWLVTAGRARAAGIVLGLGFMLKFVPAALLPGAIKYLPRGRRAGVCLWFATATMLIILPFLGIRPDLVRACLQVNAQRMAWESVWALLAGNYHFGSVDPPRDFAKACARAVHAALEIGREMNPQNPSFREGLRRLVAQDAMSREAFEETWRELWKLHPRGGQVSERLAARERQATAIVLLRSGADDRTLAQIAAIEDVARAVGGGARHMSRMMGRMCSDVSFIQKGDLSPIYIGAGALILALVIWTFVRASPEASVRNVIMFSLAMLCLFLLYSKGWSPQFGIYPIAFALLAFPDWRGFAWAVAFALVSFLEMPIWLRFLYTRPSGPHEASNFVLTVCVLARTAMLIILAALSVKRMTAR